MSAEKVHYAVSVSYGELSVKRRFKGEKGAKFELVGVMGVGIKVNEKLRVMLPLVEVDVEDFAKLAEKYGVVVEGVSAKVVEFKEEKKEEKELRFEL